MDKLLQPIIDYYNVNGKVPGKRDINSYAILWRYKSWSKAVEAAGFKPRRVVGASCKDLISSLNKFYSENGFSPRASDCNKASYLYDVDTYLEKLGVKTWGAVLEKAGLNKYFERSKKITLSDDDLLKNIKNVLTTVSATSMPFYDRHRGDLPSSAYLCQRFGSWQNILKKTGLQLNVDKYDNDELLSIISRVYKEFDKVPSSTELERYTGIPVRTWTKRFGSYNDIIKSLDLSPIHVTPCNVTESDDELIKLYRKFSEENKYDNGAPSRILDLSEDIYSSDVFCVRFGSINNLRELCGYKRIIRGVVKYTEEEIKKGLKELYHQKGAIPSVKDIKDSNLPSISCILRYCKSTSIKEAVLKSIDYDNKSN